MRLICTFLLVILTFTSLFAQTPPTDSLPQPYATKSSANFTNLVGWKKGEMPIAPEGFLVTRYADKLRNPRWIYQLPNGDVLVSEADHKIKLSANRITLLRDNDKDGTPDKRYKMMKHLDQPFGMLLLNGYLYIANTNAVVRFPYTKDMTRIKGQGEKIMSLPSGGRHWTRNIVANKDGSKLYVSVGSGSDHAEGGIEKEQRRAMIIEINPDGSNEKVYASGLRNPMGMSWEPVTNVLWTSVNERDQLGDELVPDYLAGVKDGSFYGWPYVYYGTHKDPRVKEEMPSNITAVTIPDVNLGAHTASLGLTFYSGNAFPSAYRNGAFVGQHGSWNKSVPAGYKVTFVPFKDGKPSGPQQDFLTGFMANQTKNNVHGRPVGVTVLQDGSLLVADDGGNVIWRVAAQK